MARDPLQDKIDARENEEFDDSLEERDDDSNLNVDDTDEEEWTPPSKEQWEAQQAKLRRANRQAQRLREQQKHDVLEEVEKNTVSKDELDRWKVRAVRSDAKSGLLERGADPDLVELAISRLKIDDLTFDGDGDADLADWLDDMEDRYPKLFAKQETPKPVARRKPASIDQGAGSSRNNGTKSTVEMLLNHAYGKGGARR